LVDERRFIPKTMTTQHPDNANTPPWASSTSGVIEGETELDEAYIAYSKLACSEVMWDSEGKDVDTNVVRKLLSKYSDYFMDNVFGRDIFLTYRIPNPLVEKAERKIVTQTLQSIPLQSDVASTFYDRETVPVSSVKRLRALALNCQLMFSSSDDCPAPRPGPKLHATSAIEGLQGVCTLVPEELQINTLGLIPTAIAPGPLTA
jgi:hypothetical protein